MADPASAEALNPLPVEEVQDIDESAEVLPEVYTITAYGADFPVDGLVQRLRSGDIVIPSFEPGFGSASGIEGFQRAFVWTKQQMDRFIDSLLLGLPVPGIFLVKDIDGRLLVLDGQQRLRTLQYFYECIFRAKEFRLTEVHDAFKGKTYRDLDDEQRRRVDDSIIHATIVRQEEPSDDQSSIYQVFERLNTGGTLLQPQQIRVALYRGSCVQLLRELNEFPAWRELYGRQSPTLKDQELILRFFALLVDYPNYRRPMKGFLNRFLARHRDLSDASADRWRSIFSTTTESILDGIGSRAFRLNKTVNAALVDAIMVGVAGILRSPSRQLREDLGAAFDQLLSRDEFVASVQRATADEERVRTRLRLASEVLSA